MRHPWRSEELPTGVLVSAGIIRGAAGLGLAPSLALEAKDTSSSIGPSETFLARFFVLYASVTFVDAGRFKTRLQLVRSSLLWLARQSRAFLCLA